MLHPLKVDLRNADGVGGPFPKNRIATGSLLASRTLQFTLKNPSVRVGISDEEDTAESFKTDANPSLGMADIKSFYWFGAFHVGKLR